MIDESTQPAPRAPLEASGKTEPVTGSSPAPVDRWLDEHGDALWRFVLGRVRSREVAEDVVQETVLAAMLAHAAFAGGSSERTWLLGIAAHKVADHFRAVRRHARTPGATAPDDLDLENHGPAGLFTSKGMWAKPLGDWGLDADHPTENAEMRAAMRRCLDALPPAQAEAVFLRDVLDLPGSEVCKAMGITPTNLWSRMHRARAALRDCVERAMGLGKEKVP